MFDRKIKTLSGEWLTWDSWENATVAEVPKWKNVSEGMLIALIQSCLWLRDSQGGYPPEVILTRQWCIVASVSGDEPTLHVFSLAAIRQHYIDVKNNEDSAELFRDNFHPPDMTSDELEVFASA